MPGSDLLRTYTENLRRLCGASAASAYLPAIHAEGPSLLVHCGEEPWVAELADEKVAAKLPSELPKLHGGFEIRKGKDEATRLIPLGTVRMAAGATGPGGGPRRRRTDRGPHPIGGWIGLRFDDPERAERAVTPRTHRPDELWKSVLAFGSLTAAESRRSASVGHDPVTGLPDRATLQAVLDSELAKAQAQKTSVALLLINPDEFAAINERFGRQAGDSVVREMSERLRLELRGSDFLSRYGGVIFAALLPETDSKGAKVAAGKLLEGLAEDPYLDGAVRLGFSIGLAASDTLDPKDNDSLAMVRHADQALNDAKRHGGGRVGDWKKSTEAEETGAFDRLSGIFTGSIARDYRNMTLLWDTIDAIASEEDFAALSRRVVDSLVQAFKPTRASVFVVEEGNLQRLYSAGRDRAESSDEEDTLAAGAVEDGTLVRRTDEDGDMVGIPLRVTSREDGETVGCLALDLRHTSAAIDTHDITFFKALAGQLAVALDRAQLSERDRLRLKAELSELRQALQQSKLVYRSPEMERIVETAKRVAPTDATVLITGESGTGKELLARTLHELSPRKEKAFVIVDCAAIATTLIESELFGHQKGAYTGAEKARPGRIEEADGGTILLDEIGELPMEVQSRLLRFVQEKQFTRVGDTKQRRVDVRIIASTNRDLGMEAAAGRFREDLYYRLNVVRLEVPPLRDRTGDVLVLAKHFLETYAVQYQSGVSGFTEEAEAVLEAHDWPGNIRELQNRVMQAVILGDREQLDPDSLGLEDVSPGKPRKKADPEPETEAPPPPIEESFEALRTALGRQIDAALSAGSTAAVPLGRWLAEDLVKEANRAADRVASRAARRVGLPETTFRRRLRDAAQKAEAGLSPRSGPWSEVARIVTQLVRSPEAEEADILETGQAILLDEVLQRVPNDVRRGSALLGVTPPTFKRRVAGRGA